MVTQIFLSVCVESVVLFIVRFSLVKYSAGSDVNNSVFKGCRIVCKKFFSKLLFVFLYHFINIVVQRCELWVLGVLLSTVVSSFMAVLTYSSKSLCLCLSVVPIILISILLRWWG